MILAVDRLICTVNIQTIRPREFKTRFRTHALVKKKKKKKKKMNFGIGEKYCK